MRMAMRLAAAMISLSLEDHSRTALCRLWAATYTLYVHFRYEYVHLQTYLNKQL